MRTHVEFRSDAFPPYPGEEGDINPGCWGKRLAEFIAGKLPEHGLRPDELIAEDWGWEVPVRNEAFPMFVGCANYEEWPDGFLCFVEPSKPEVRRGLFKKVSTVADVERVAGALDAILRGHEGIRDVRWWADDER